MTKYKFHNLRTTNQQQYNHLRWQQYKEEIDRTKHWKEQVIKEILENLISKNKRIGNYTKDDIDKAIIQVRGIDQRTRKNWFNLIWRLEYLIQPKPHLFQLNYTKISELDVKLPIELDPKQSRL